MQALQPADKVEIRVLVDNATDMLSSNPPFVESESGYLNRRGFKVSSARCLCCAVHGLSCLITVHRGGKTRTVLFDTGPEDYAFERNVTRLGVDLGVVEGIVLSHGHWDHGGGLVAAVEAVAARRPGAPVPCFVHPGMFGQRGSQRPDGVLIVQQPVPKPEQLAAAGASVQNTRS